MARKQPAHRVLMYILPDGESYIDIAQDLSKINRRLYRQGMQYAVQKVEFAFAADLGAVASTSVTAYAAGDTWVVHNAWKKAYAHWIAQQRRARRLIGPSAKPTWEDFKIYLDDAHRTAGSLSVKAGDGASVGGGEWDHSVLHVEAEDHSIQEWYMHLIGGDISTTDRGLILGYQESRATVQAEDPDLPSEYSDNMYASLADDIDDVAREVADDMEAENDEPPYDHDDYVGNDTNSDRPFSMEAQYASSGNPNATLDGFVAQCGLVLFNVQSWQQNGAAVTQAPPTPSVMVHLAPGGYKGVAAIPMGQ